jgi:hypothetical protein
MAQQTSTKSTISLTALAFLALLVALNGGPAQAQLYVATTGNNANACTSSAEPCLTIQGAIDKVPGGSLGTLITIAAGTYNETPNIYYYRAIHLVGNCNDLTAVQITTDGIGIVVQDHAIGIIECMTISATANGATGIVSRQFSIVDADRLRFSGFPEGNYFSAVEGSTLSCVPGPNGEPIVLTGSASTFASASDGSHLKVNCPVSFQSSQTYTHFISCTELSVCKATGLAWAGLSITGKQYNCDNSDFTQPSGSPPTGYTKSIPGTGFDDPDLRCKLR